MDTSNISKLLSIDMGIVNVGVSIFNINNLIVDEIICNKLNWKLWNMNHLQDIIDKFNLSKSNTIICLEFQIYKNREMIKRMYYSQGFFEGLGYKVHLIQPITKKLKLKNRKSKKQYSVDEINKLFNENLTFDDHDITDSILIGYNFLENNNIKNINKALLNIVY